MKKKVLFGCASVILIVSLLANVFSALNMLANSSDVEVGSICGGEYIEKINKIIDSNDSSQDSMSALLSDIASKKDYKQDANCSAMVFITAFNTGDVDKAKTEYENLLSLGEKNKTPSMKINFSMTYSSMKDMIDFYSSDSNIKTSEPGVNNG